MSSKSYVSKKRNYKKTAKAGKLNQRQKKEVKQILHGNLELKTADEGGAPTVSNVPTVSKWFALAQGVGNSQRIGNQIDCSHMELSYELTTGDTTNVLRIIVFQWREDDIAIGPVYTDILYRPNSSVPYTNALYNFDNRGSYKILYDKKHFIDADNDVVSAFGHKKYIKIPHSKIDFNGAGATTGKNMIYVLSVSDSAAAAHPGFINQSRLYYRDA